LPRKRNRKGSHIDLLAGRRLEAGLTGRRVDPGLMGRRQARAYVNGGLRCLRQTGKISDATPSVGCR